MFRKACRCAPSNPLQRLTACFERVALRLPSHQLSHPGSTLAAVQAQKAFFYRFQAAVRHPQTPQTLRSASKDVSEGLPLEGLPLRPPSQHLSLPNNTLTVAQAQWAFLSGFEGAVWHLKPFKPSTAPQSMFRKGSPVPPLVSAWPPCRPTNFCLRFGSCCLAPNPPQRLKACAGRLAAVTPS